MKYCALFVVLASFAASQSSAQMIRQSSPCGCSGPSLVPNLVGGAFVSGPGPVLAPPCASPGPLIAPQVYAAPQQVYAPQPVYSVQGSDVAGTLADTLSLLTVSSLLAEKLSYGCPPVAVPSCGCGCNCGCNCGSPYSLGGYYL